MPELPEVETVRRGLVPALEGARITRLEQRRADLRFPLPADLAERLEGARVGEVRRRAKYLVLPLDTGESLIAHLGMTGRFKVGAHVPGRFEHEADTEKHEHLVLHAEDGAMGPARVGFVDARRFGYWDLVWTDDLSGCRHFAGMGPEPLGAPEGEEWDGRALHGALAGKRTPIKAALLDQRVVAGLGNIYVCEALWRARISPRRQAANVGRAKADALAGHVRDVLIEAIEAGGSTLRDFASAEGSSGYFQHRFDAYGREGAPCPRCAAPIRRIVQSGRSTFYCSRCQR